MIRAENGKLDLVEVLHSLHTVLLTTPHIEGLLSHVADVAAGLVDPRASCAITTRYEGLPVTVVSSDGKAAEIDEAQYVIGAGPCLQSLATGQVVDVPDINADQRWPEYLEAARKHGMRSSLSLPLTVGDETVGAMNIYDYTRAHAFEGEVREQLQTFATQAATSLAVALRLTRQAETAVQLEAALSSRSVIDQAIGILMAQQHCSAEAAFALLRTHSQNNNLKLRTVAERIVAKVSGHPPVATPGFSGERLDEAGDTQH